MSEGEGLLTKARLDEGERGSVSGSSSLAPDVRGGALHGEVGRDANTEVEVFRHRKGISTVPLISFIVPVYNTASTVLRTLNSIASADPAGTVEIVVVHDGGNDDSLSVVEKWASSCPVDLVILDQANRGLSAARMTGAKHARGLFLAFLDSDDHINAQVFCRMAEAALDDGWDVGLCRSAVWDMREGTVYPFYDSHIWDNLCDRRPITVASVATAPLLLRLEPNANPRIIRRDFFEQEGLSFPEGLLFEDLPVHFLALIKSRRTGLFNATGYYYAISRPGKITETRSTRRFDMIAVGRMAIDTLLDNHVQKEAGAAALALLARMLFWCGQMTPNSKRAEYFDAAASLFINVPRRWTTASVRRVCREHRERLELFALACGDVRLAGKLCDKRFAWPSVGTLLSPFWRLSIKLTRAHVRRRLSRRLRRDRDRTK